jgi:histone deacetylase 1/2
MDDLNVKDGSLDKVRITALHQLAQLPCAPLVAMHDVSRVTLGKHLGLEVEEDQVNSEMDDLDHWLAHK